MGDSSLGIPLPHTATIITKISTKGLSIQNGITMVEVLLLCPRWMSGLLLSTLQCTELPSHKEFLVYTVDSGDDGFW